MFRKLVLSAFGAGIVVCLIVSALQLVTTEPLILHAEVFEKGQGSAGHQHREPTATPIQHSSTAQEPGGAAWEPADGLERTLYTALANFVVGIAISMMLLGAMALKGETIDARRGLLWGLGGFAAASLLPALGLPPELPGTPSADIFARQTWWASTALASAAGIALIAFAIHWMGRVVGLVLLVAPHVIGAPEAPSLEAAYPAVLAGEFVIASVVVSAVLWSLSGLAAGWLHQRLSRAG